MEYGWFAVGQERRLLGIFGRHEVLVAKGKRECLAGLESVGVGIRRPIRVDIEIVGQHVDDFADRAVDVGIRVSWIQANSNLVAK